MKYIKKQIIITAIAVFIGGVSFAQVTLLDTQTKVNNFSKTTVTGNLTIRGSSITNVTSLNALTSISGALNIQFNPNLTSLAGLEVLTSVNDLGIRANSKLTNLRGLETLTRATLLVVIFDNIALTSLEGLEKLTTIGSLGLTIYSNLVLSTLNGLNNLTTLDGKLLIGTSTGTSLGPNPALTNFCAISQLVSSATPEITETADAATNEYFVINNGYNPTYAGLASGTVETATDQNDGCAEFGTVITEPPITEPPVVSTNTFSKEEDYRLFPNPVKDILFVKSESKITSITISNVSGQEVLKSNSASIHVGGLSKGIYFARIVSGEKTVVEKFVKL